MRGMKKKEKERINKREYLKRRKHPLSTTLKHYFVVRVSLPELIEHSSITLMSLNVLLNQLVILSTPLS